MFGRRDRAPLVLTQLAGVPYKYIAVLTAGDISIADGVATVRSAAGEWTLRPADDAVVCGPCPFTCRVRNALPFLVMPGTSVIGPSTPNGFPAGGSQRSNRRSNNVQRFWPDAWTISVWISATVSRTSMVEPCRKWISTWPSSIDCQNVTWWQLTNIAVGSTPSLNRPITPFTMMFTL